MKDVLRPCPICNCRQADVLYNQQFATPDGYLLPSAYDLVICLRCCMVYADTPATQAVYDSFYASSSIYEQPAGVAHSATSAEDLARLEQTAELFAGQLPDKTARVLDVGCANGGLLQIFARHGFDNLVGVDPSPACVQNTRACGFQAYCGDLAHLPPELGLFDAVILTSVLEHVLEVRSAIAALVKVCAPGGRIFLEVPDAAHYVDYLHAPYQDINTEHINHFSVASVRNLMAQFGFASILERQLPVPGPSGMMFAGLEAAYERGAAPSTLLLDPSFRSQMESYLQTSRTMMESIDRHLRRTLAPWPEIIVWGAGQLTMKLLCDTVLKEANIAAFLDGNPAHAGKTIRGVPILHPEALGDQHAPILIATLLHSHAIRGRIESLGLSNPVLSLEPH